ncbi:hypothetical protein HanHA300_Chr03g0095911 [Helianthus annuus]|nr:hypothetical protein HanHA300_Chr03g0095911 [Helianthus annuus]KAJ0601206.1 hypothetical protein HanIR_Chr03g0125741 [Helianthus annuus]KAJ0608351.1 hypothetical protein HanHA89_Chr03g0107601 [Helianthus annuus]KAJ0768415.1 hypothetical protein HanLR1_Chr03g0100971 [Helianthus annuus]KAJ0774168.1 hypothetical protein HanOQP8_Chr03g0108521 [Helianthus annuus]
MIPNVRAKGKVSVRVADMLNRMQAKEHVNLTVLFLNIIVALCISIILLIKITLTLLSETIDGCS